jgi:hypothetical protein
MEIETKSFLASLGAPESLMGILLVAGALLFFRATLFGQSLRHIPLVREELGKSGRMQAFKRDPKDVLADGYKKVIPVVCFVITLVKLRWISVQINLSHGHTRGYTTSVHILARKI